VLGDEGKCVALLCVHVCACITCMCIANGLMCVYCPAPQAAWRKLEAQFPWLTCTCCGTHVINLELKDMGKLEEVQDIFAQSAKVLALFWGKKRWPRKKLREVIAANHNGAQFGLYRAKQTRFAGRYRELSRMLRVKAELMQVVVSNEYNSHRFTVRGKDWDEETGERLDENIGEQVRTIILSKDFWTSVTDILSVALPLIKLLRTLDGNKPVMGKIYHRMFTISEKIEGMCDRVDWAEKMKSIHSRRWEYLHSPMHAAAYALDPEYMTVAKQLDSHCQHGLRVMLKRQCLRDVMVLQADPNASVSVDDPAVVQRVAQAEREFSSYQRMEGPFSDASCQHNASIMEPAKWWDMYGRHLPLLSSIAPRILAQTAAASCAERNWSVYGQIKNDHRCRMKHATADRLVYLHEGFHLLQRMQDAGWSADVERWESDSDDSDSDADGDDASLLALMR
jgi:hypothetical protein